MSFSSILGKIAPELEAGLSLVGGPFGAIGAMAVKGVAAIVAPGKDNASVSDIQAALAGATPDQLLALQKLNDEFKLKTQELKLDVLQLQQQQEATDAADRASARTLAIARGFWPQIILSGVFTLGYFGLLILLLTGGANIQPSVHDILTALLGVMTAGMVQIMNFWFGSSHGSQKKDDALANAALAE